MTDKPIELDRHRGMHAQRATDLRRLLTEVEANETALRLRQEELEAHLVAAPSEDWDEVKEKVRYILRLYVATLAKDNTRGRVLVDVVLADLARFSLKPPTVDG